MNKSKQQSAAVSAPNETAPRYVSKIEAESLRLLETAKATGEEMAAYYPQMLEEGHSDAETQEKAASLKRATGNITKALAQTYSVSDEFNARRNDLKHQKA